MDWLGQLGRLVAPGMALQEAGERVRAYAPELVARFDSRDFTAASREWVGRHCKFFPSYAELCELLERWPRPAAGPQLVGPKPEGLTEQDLLWLAYWRRREAERFSRGDREVVLSLVRSNSPAAYRAIVGPDTEPTRPIGTTPDLREIAAVSSAISQLTLDLRAAAMARAETEQANKRAPRPLPDVTAHGAHLRALREGTGLANLQPPEPDDEEDWQ